tara:strand:+ start:6088 stop:8052 length:1965 start_codon:yes stop_codon:yes gene_type:complete
MTDKWRWETPARGRVAIGGNLENLFRAKPRKAPGHLELGKPSDSATLLAREAIQNSWDAAIEHAAGTDSDRQMTLVFDFSELSVAESKKTISTLGLEELKDQANAAGGWKAVQIPGEDVFDFTMPNNQLKVLRISEGGTTGMYGPWDETALKPSKMILALLAVGMPEHRKGAQHGGAFGHGKAGLISASATRTVIAYSCFKDDETNRSGATRRLYGVTYWAQHAVGKRRFVGFGHFGVHGDDLTLPYEDAEADEVAASLGFEIRDPAAPEGLGTSFLIVEPLVEPEDLRHAVERNWWPALLEYEDFVIDIVDYEGNMHPPSPKMDPELKPYLRAFEIASKAEAATLADTERFSRPNDLKLGSRGNRPTPIGRLGLVADPEGWSFPPEDGLDHRSLVAMIRGPRMVTEYFDTATGQLRQVRGVFLADDLVDGLLTQAEPPMHDDWSEAAGGGGVDPDAPTVAKRIHSTTKSRVNDFRNALRPPAPAAGEYHLPELAKLMKDLFRGGGKRPPPPPAPPRLVHIEPKGRQDRHKSSGGQIHMTASCSFSLTETAKEDRFSSLLTGGRLHARISVKYQFDEDGRIGSAADSRCKLNLSKKLDPSFTVTNADDGSLTIDGPISDEVLDISVRSAPYDRDYTGQIRFGIGPIPTPGEPNA